MSLAVLIRPAAQKTGTFRMYMATYGGTASSPNDADMLMVGNAACPESNYCLPHAANATEPTGGWPCSHGGSHTPGGWPHGNYDDCGTCMHCDGFSIAEETSQLVLWAIFASPFYLSADPRPGSIRPASKALLLNREIIAV